MSSKEYVDAREGGYYVSGSRVSLDSLIYAFRRGESPETICQNFEVLHLEEVYGAIAYYLGHQAEIDAYLVSQGRSWAEAKRQSSPLPSDLREKLSRARNQLQSHLT